MTLAAEAEDPSNDCERLSEDVLVAQREAEQMVEADEKAGEKAIATEDEELAPMPRLLEMDPDALLHRTKDLKARGDQLDLLLLKAESYSHFIRLNQEQNERALRESRGKRRRSEAGREESPSKRRREEESALIAQPPNLVGGSLKPYQLDGLRWLVSLWENGLSGILGDEMGLGKTIQVIALIAYLRNTNITGPFLIAGPLATLPNWINEFKKWLPSCPTLLYHGDKKERHRLREQLMHVGDVKKLTFPVVVTSFEICMIDRSHLERYEWQYLILDEGHRIKNRNCRLVKELKSLRSVSRLLLTGTPIQNTLEELWSLLNFVNPRIFDDLEVFQAWFGFRNIGRDTQVDDIIGSERRERIVSKLHEILRPFLLRRLKKDVLLNLTEKREIVVYCQLSKLQREYYARVQKKTLKELLVSLGLEDAKQFSSENTLMQLRKVCNHPFLFGEPRDSDGDYLGDKHPLLLISASGKFQLMDRMLDRLKRDNHRVLIFSQMTKLLDILQDYCSYKKYRLCRIDGGTKLSDRQEAIDTYNNDPEIFVFLLSTRAGGLGINLTGADTVILFDSDWNPHQDSQAQDRCHRIGQQRNVVTYRLLTAGTVEIEMMERQVSKKKLERLAIVGGDFGRAGSRDGGSMSLQRLRRLLEDDVKGLANRRTDSSTAMVEMLVDKENYSASISETELDRIMNRVKLFEDDNDIPMDGEMYDILRPVELPAFEKIA